MSDSGDFYAGLREVLTGWRHELEKLGVLNAREVIAELMDCAGLSNSNKKDLDGD